MLRGPTQSQTSAVTPSTCSLGASAGECSVVFIAYLLETSDPNGLVHNNVADIAEDCANLITGCKLGKDLIPGELVRVVRKGGLCGRRLRRAGAKMLNWHT